MYATLRVRRLACGLDYWCITAPAQTKTHALQLARCKAIFRLSRGKSLRVDHPGFAEGLGASGCSGAPSTCNRTLVVAVDLFRMHRRLLLEGTVVRRRVYCCLHFDSVAAGRMSILNNEFMVEVCLHTARCLLSKYLPSDLLAYQCEAWRSHGTYRSVF